MDFFAHQDKARQNTRLMVFLFGLATLGISAITTRLFILFFPQEFILPIFLEEHGNKIGLDWNHLDWNATVWYMAMVFSLIIFISFLKTLYLRRNGGAKIAEAMGGRLIYPDSEDPKERVLLNVVEEMALASGTPVPSVYVLDSEKNLNAFAAGNEINSAVIGVTSGLLESLNRVQLQGVIAHEFSHIAHGDMKLNLRLIGVLFGILCVKEAGEYLLRSYRYGNRRYSGKVVFIGLGLMIIGVVGFFFGQLIKSAISRQREFLADASAVQYTRNPKGIASALRRIGAIGSTVQTPRATEISHMFFAKGVGGAFTGLMTTHPKLKERISRIEGRRVPKSMVQASKDAAEMNDSFSMGNSMVGGFVGGGAPVHFLDQIGDITSEKVEQTSLFLQSLPENIIHGAREPYTARAVVLLLFLKINSNSLQIQEVNLDIQISIGHELIQLTKAFHQSLKTIDTNFRIPLIDLCIPALKQMSAEQKREFIGWVYQLITRDESIELVEYILFAILRQAVLGENVQAPRKNLLPISSGESAVIILSALSEAGHKEATSGLTAFRQGLKVLGMPPDKTRPVQWNVYAIDRALRRINTLGYNYKKKFLQACLIVTQSDSMLTPEEKELLRGVADSLGCPISAFDGTDLNSSKEMFS